MHHIANLDLLWSYEPMEEEQDVECISTAVKMTSGGS